MSWSKKKKVLKGDKVHKKMEQRRAIQISANTALLKKKKYWQHKAP